MSLLLHLMNRNYIPFYRITLYFEKVYNYVWMDVYKDEYHVRKNNLKRKLMNIKKYLICTEQQNSHLSSKCFNNKQWIL